MIPLTRLKKDVQFNGEFTKVVDVMKGIAAARYYMLERQLSLFEQFFKVAGELLAVIDFKRVSHPFVRQRTEAASVLMITSDAGFLGGLNTQVVNMGLSEGGSDALLTVVGERGAGILRDLRREFALFPGVEDSKRFLLAVRVRDHLVDQVLKGQTGRLIVVYPKPISFAVQEVTVETLLPCSAWIPKDGGAAAGEVVWESELEDVVEYVVAQWISRYLDKVFARSRLSELAARAVHLEGSYQELIRFGKKLKFQYFRARHEVIDRSMREIFASQLFCGKEHED